MRTRGPTPWTTMGSVMQRSVIKDAAIPQTELNSRLARLSDPPASKSTIRLQVSEADRLGLEANVRATTVISFPPFVWPLVHHEPPLANPELSGSRDQAQSSCHTYKPEPRAS